MPSNGELNGRTSGGPRAEQMTHTQNRKRNTYFFSACFWEVLRNTSTRRKDRPGSRQAGRVGLVHAYAVNAAGTRTGRLTVGASYLFVGIRNSGSVLRGTEMDA